MSPITYVADNINKPATNRILELSDGIIAAIRVKNDIQTNIIITNY